MGTVPARPNDSSNRLLECPASYVYHHSTFEAPLFNEFVCPRYFVER